MLQAEVAGRTSIAADTSFVRRTITPKRCNNRRRRDRACPLSDQRGYLRLGHRRCGPDCWEFLWWDREPTGIRVRRKAIIGTIQQYPNVEDAWQASNGLRVSINEARNRQPEQAITIADLIDHYSATELAADAADGGKSHATRTVYREFLTRWVRPAWGSLNIRDVRTVAVERWLHQLVRKEGSPLAPSTKAKIRNLMSVLFNHAIRQEWLEQGRNPILLVRQSAKRQRIPAWLEPEELRALLSQLDWCFRVMVFLDAATGLRRSELLALKWGDVEFDHLQIRVQRSIYMNVLGDCKTEALKRPVPMDPIHAALRRLRMLSRSSTSSRRALYGTTLVWPTGLLSLPT
jgi:integrase